VSRCGVVASACRARFDVSPEEALGYRLQSPIRGAGFTATAQTLQAAARRHHGRSGETRRRIAAVAARLVALVATNRWRSSWRGRTT
jgi:hypothetical protein